MEKNIIGEGNLAKYLKLDFVYFIFGCKTVAKKANYLKAYLINSA